MTGVESPSGTIRRLRSELAAARDTIRTLTDELAAQHAACEEHHWRGGCKTLAECVHATQLAYVARLTDDELTTVVPRRSECHCSCHTMGRTKCNHAGSCCVPDPDPAPAVA